MTIRRAAAWSLSSQYSIFVVQFAASVIISRFFLLPADVGLFSIALAAAMIFAVFQDVGITRFVSGQREMRPEAVSSYAMVAVVFGWAVAAVVALAAPWVAGFYGEPQLTRLLWLIAASYVIAPFAIVPAALLVREMNFKALFAVNAGSITLGSGIGILLAWQGHGATSLAGAVLTTALARTVLAFAFRPVLPRWPDRAEALKPILSFSSSSFFISASSAIGQRSQDLIVGRLLGTEATGLFTRASALAGQLSALVTGAISSVFYAAFARKRDAGEPLAKPYLHLVACNTALNWAAMVGLAVAAEPVVLLLYGENWAEAARLLRWLAIGEMLFVAIPLQMDVPILLGRIRKLIWVNLFDTAAAVTILTIGCTLGLEAAALSRIAYGLVWWAIYAVFQSQLLEFRMIELLAIYARSGLCAVAAGIPLLAATALNWQGAALGFFGLVGLSMAGVLTWLAALWLTQHPAWAEVRTALASITQPLRVRLAG